VLVTKVDADGKPVLYKARLVARGFQQREHGDTYSPVCRLETVRALIALASIHSLDLRHVDFTNAFVNAKIDDEVYIKLPTVQGLHGGGSVRKLNRALYGLKSSPRLWNEALHKTIVELPEFNFKVSSSDRCLYVGNYKGRFIAVGIHVDDVLIAAAPDVGDALVKQLATTYALKLGRGYSLCWLSD